VHNVNDVIAEPSVPGPSWLEDEIAVTKSNIYKSLGNDQILAEMMQAGGEALMYVIHKLINSSWNKEEMPVKWKEFTVVPVHKNGDKTDCNNYRGIPLLSVSYKII
jgi:hypothetical protein